MIFTKGIQKIIASAIALLMTLSTMFIAAWAILSTEKVGLSINVSYDPLVTAKAYISTNSSTAGDLRQINPTINTETSTDFDISKSALILNTYDTDPLTKNSFEQLGTGDSNGLKCDANGEMEFYVYVENYSETETVYYRANINFTGDNETAPFSTVTNPDYELAETAGGGVALPRAY